MNPRLFAVLLVCTLLTSCGGALTAPAHLSAGAPAAGAPPPPPAVDYTVPGTVPRLKQDKTMACWATTTAILVSWKEKKTVDTPKLVARLSGKFQVIYETNAGLLPKDQPDLLKEAGMRQEAPQNYTVDGWVSLLKSHGPLWVTTAIGAAKPFAVHARVLIAIKGDGTPGGTTLRIVDPGDGSESTATVAAFARQMEALARLDLGASGDIRPMVIHF